MIGQQACPVFWQPSTSSIQVNNSRKRAISGRQEERGPQAAVAQRQAGDAGPQEAALVLGPRQQAARQGPVALQHVQPQAEGAAHVALEQAPEGPARPQRPQQPHGLQPREAAPGQRRRAAQLQLPALVRAVAAARLEVLARLVLQRRPQRHLLPRAQPLHRQAQRLVPQAAPARHQPHARGAHGRAGAGGRQRAAGGGPLSAGTGCPSPVRPSRFLSPGRAPAAPPSPVVGLRRRAHDERRAGKEGLRRGGEDSFCGCCESDVTRLLSPPGLVLAASPAPAAQTRPGAVVCFPVAEARYFTSARRMNISTLCSSNNPFAIDDKLRVTLSESHEPSGHFQSCSNSPVDLQTTKTTRPLQDTCLSQPCYSQCYVKYLKKIATDLRFSKEVVKHRGLPTLPYKECDFKYLYDASGIIQKPQNKESIAKKVGQPLKLHPLKQPPCLLKSDIPPPTGTREESLWRTKRQSSPSPLLHETPFSKTFLTESHEMSSTAVTRRGQEKKVSPGDASVSRIRCQGWEEMLLKKLNRTTAQWIVNQQATWGGWIQDKPHSFTKQKFDWNRIRDELSSESDLKLLDEIQAGEDAMEVSSQSQAQQKPETLLPVYYRLPAYCTRVLPADDPVGYNSTADETERKCLRPASPMKKWERPTSCLRKYTYAAKNAFEHELYFGTVKIVHQMDKRGKDCFILENHDEYYKHLQQHFPRPPVHWSFQPQKAAQKPEKGAFRWTALPTQADDFVQRGQEPPQAKTSKGRKEPKESKAGLPEDMHILRTMLEQWKNAWKLTPQWQNATIEGLTRALTDIHDVVRVSAIITCASAVVERPRSDTSNQESVVEIDGTGKVPEIQDVPEELQPLLKKTLRHESAHVRMAAAVCHYATGMRNEEARAVMQDALVHGNSADSWAAAQCLALDGIITLPVVTKILSQLFDKNDETTEKQACLLLTQLSERTSLVYSLLAAKLNSCQWKDRILACKALSRIRGYVSQDLKNKLVQLMWKDWKLDVRQAAALALGHMKFGKEVHDQLRVKLKRGDCRTKVEALSLIGWLRFMTAKLLPGFLQCFSNDFVAVRREACLTAGALRIKDETVLKCLLKTMQTDPHWKIKAFAIRGTAEFVAKKPFP